MADVYNTNYLVGGRERERKRKLSLHTVDLDAKIQIFQYSNNQPVTMPFT